MARDEYEALAARSFDEPHDVELRAQILVCGDDLSQSGDPRGPLITMEHALRDAATPRREIELRNAIHEHAAEHCLELLGRVTTLLAVRRKVTLEWRSGKIYGAQLDARYPTGKDQDSAGELVQILLQAPAADSLRRLRVRVRGDEQIESVFTTLAKRKHPQPLEELEVSQRSWPTGLGEPVTFPLQQRTTSLVGIGGKYPYLYHLAIGDQICSISLNKPNERFNPESHVSGIRIAEPPIELEARVLLGRALMAQQVVLRSAALARIAELGPVAAVYTRSLEVLLQPRLIENQIEVIAAYAALGPSHARARVLSKIASRADAYDAVTRRAAGVAAVRVRPVDP